MTRAARITVYGGISLALFSRAEAGGGELLPSRGHERKGFSPLFSKPALPSHFG